AGYDIQKGYLPLSVVRPLLRSKRLRKLTHLRLRCSSMGDEGVWEIVDSGALKRLRVLDLRHGCVTNEGGQILAECADLTNLRSMDLDRNGLSSEGVEHLTRLGIPLRINNQQTQAELNPTDEYRRPQYLYEGEFE